MSTPAPFFGRSQQNVLRRVDVGVLLVPALQTMEKRLTRAVPWFCVAASAAPLARVLGVYPDDGAIQHLRFGLQHRP